MCLITNFLSYAKVNGYVCFYWFSVTLIYFIHRKTGRPFVLVFNQVDSPTLYNYVYLAPQLRTESKFFDLLVISWHPRTFAHLSFSAPVDFPVRGLTTFEKLAENYENRAVEAAKILSEPLSRSAFFSANRKYSSLISHLLGQWAGSNEHSADKTLERRLLLDHVPETGSMIYTFVYKHGERVWAISVPSGPLPFGAALHEYWQEFKIRWLFGSGSLSLFYIDPTHHTGDFYMPITHHVTTFGKFLPSPYTLISNQY